MMHRYVAARPGGHTKPSSSTQQPVGPADENEAGRRQSDTKKSQTGPANGCYREVIRRPQNTLTCGSCRIRLAFVCWPLDLTNIRENKFPVEGHPGKISACRNAHAQYLTPKHESAVQNMYLPLQLTWRCIGITISCDIVNHRPDKARERFPEFWQSEMPPALSRLRWNNRKWYQVT